MVLFFADKYTWHIVTDARNDTGSRAAVRVLHSSVSSLNQILKDLLLNI